MTNEGHMTNFLMSISFSVFGMLLIFGLGFVFPAVNPYEVIKWIVVVVAAVFLYTFLAYIFSGLRKLKIFQRKKKGGKK